MTTHNSPLTIHNSSQPKLRFPEFRDAGEWVEKNLSQLTTKISDGIHATPIYDENGEYVFINGNNLSSGKILIDNKTKRVDFFEYTKHKKPLDSSSILISINGTIGNLAFFRDELVILGKSVCFINVNLKLADKFFIYSIIQTNMVKNIFAAEATGSTIKNLSLNAIKNLQLLVPTLSEQQKIAACLSSLDELITAHSQKLDALKKHKKGIMQQLFPAEGETVPTLRFPEFRDKGEWVEKRLNQISSSIFDGTHQTPKYVETGVPFFSVENIVSGKANKFISNEDYLIATAKNKPEKGDILITRIGNIGYSAVVDWDYEFSIYVTLAVIKGNNSFNSYFLHCYFQSKRYQNEILSKSLLNAIPCKINMDELRKTNVLLPKPEEQQKIAACLSSLDELITAHSQKLDALKKHKKGLMQQLFPTVDEGGA